MPSTQQGSVMIFNHLGIVLCWGRWRTLLVFSSTATLVFTYGLYGRRALLQFGISHLFRIHVGTCKSFRVELCNDVIRQAGYQILPKRGVLTSGHPPQERSFPTQYCFYDRNDGCAETYYCDRWNLLMRSKCPNLTSVVAARACLDISSLR